MKRKQTRDFLIRNQLEKSAKEHNHQEAIVHRIRQPKPFKWREKISSQFIERAIDEGCCNILYNQSLIKMDLQSQKIVWKWTFQVQFSICG